MIDGHFTDIMGELLFQFKEFLRKTRRRRQAVEDNKLFKSNNNWFWLRNVNWNRDVSFELCLAWLDVIWKESFFSFGFHENNEILWFHLAVNTWLEIVSFYLGKSREIREASLWRMCQVVVTDVKKNSSDSLHSCLVSKQFFVSRWMVKRSSIVNDNFLSFLPRQFRQKTEIIEITEIAPNVLKWLPCNKTHQLLLSLFTLKLEDYNWGFNDLMLSFELTMLSGLCNAFRNLPFESLQWNLCSSHWSWMDALRVVMKRFQYPSG